MCQVSLSLTKRDGAIPTSKLHTIAWIKFQGFSSLCYKECLRFWSITLVCGPSSDYFLVVFPVNTKVRVTRLLQPTACCVSSIFSVNFLSINTAREKKNSVLPPVFFKQMLTRTHTRLWRLYPYISRKCNVLSNILSSFDW